MGIIQNPIYSTRYSSVDKDHNDPDDGTIRVHTDLQGEEYISGWEWAENDAFYGDGLIALNLSFDGCALSATYTIAKGKVISTKTVKFKAVSGKEDGEASPLNPNGPLPNGSYSFNLSDLEYRFQTNFWGSYTYPSWAKNENLHGDPTWSREADAYGDYRVKLKVNQFSEIPNKPRDGFYLHGSQGSNGFGSLGCIDLGTITACNGFLGSLYDYYQDTGLDVKANVNVNKTCVPWKIKGGAGGQFGGGRR